MIELPILWKSRVAKFESTNRAVPAPGADVLAPHEPVVDVEKEALRRAVCHRRRARPSNVADADEAVQIGDRRRLRVLARQVDVQAPERRVGRDRLPRAEWLQSCRRERKSGPSRP